MSPRIEEMRVAEITASQGLWEDSSDPMYPDFSICIYGNATLYKTSSLTQILSIHFKDQLTFCRLPNYISKQVTENLFELTGSMKIIFWKSAYDAASNN